MNLKKIKLDKVLPVLLLFFMVAYVLSPGLKSWITRGLMSVGFFKPDIPQLRPGTQYQPAPPIQLQTPDGKTINLPDEKGKVIFINFWATWCPPCLAELPTINALYEKIKGNPNVVFVTVDIDGDLPKSTKFLLLKDYGFPVYAAVGAEKLYSEGIPTTLVIDMKGSIVYSHFNRANYSSDQFEKFIDDLAKQP
ncbi:MAG: TlpA family protein disulfide reductase [Mucilaginibacter sp.]